MTLSKIFRIKTIVIALIVIAALFFIKIIFFPTPEAPNYITATVERGDIEQTVLADGTISAFKQVSVGAQVSGQIKKLYVELGDSVVKDQLIAEIDDLTQQNNLKQAEASLTGLEAQRTSKEATLRNNQLSYDRHLKLVNKGAGAQSDLDEARALLDSIKADIKALDANIVSAQIAVDTAKLNLGYTKITSPIDGVVVAAPVEEGQTVNSVQSAPTIVKVAQLDKMTVEAQISEADVIKVKKGDAIYFTILGQPNKRYENLTLRAIEPAPDSINNESSASSSTSSNTTAIYYNGLFDVDNPDRVLRISMTAQVYIVLASAKDVLLVPSMAIQFGSDSTVQVLDADGNVSERTVKVGINNNIQAEILSGLQEGDEVIVSGMLGNAKTNAPSVRIRR